MAAAERRVELAQAQVVSAAILSQRSIFFFQGTEMVANTEQRRGIFEKVLVEIEPAEKIQ